MFTTTRIKLTIWYLLIIMCISVMFSITIYRILSGELDREASRISEHYKREYGLLPLPGRPLVEPQIIQASEERIILSLIYVNVVIFVIAGVGGYILAGLTLKPIREMIDEQNRFIADASHELRTPITSLRSEIEVYMRAGHHTVRDANILIQSNLEEANNLQVLSDNLIDLAQYKKSPIAHPFSKHSLKSLLTTAAKHMEKPAKQKKISIEIHVPEFGIHGNSEQLIKLFTIFLDNAIKYSPQNTTVTLRAKRVDGLVQIVVKDEGIGIEEKDMPHIFDRFYRADISRTKQSVSGYGLGLSIAKQIVDEHNGTIFVESAPGKGTTFTLRLPT